MIVTVYNLGTYRTTEGLIYTVACHMLFWSTMSDSFNPHCRLCLRLRHHVWASVSCWLIWNSTFMFALACVCVGACVSFFSQNLPCGRSRPWASVRRVCARLSQLCRLKLCRLKLSSFLRSVCPTLSPFSSPFHPFLRAALPFLSNSHCKGLFEASSIPLRSFQIIAPHYPLLPLMCSLASIFSLPPCLWKRSKAQKRGPQLIKSVEESWWPWLSALIEAYRSSGLQAVWKDPL